MKAKKKWKYKVGDRFRLKSNPKHVVKIFSIGRKYYSISYKDKTGSYIACIEEKWLKQDFQRITK